MLVVLGPISVVTPGTLIRATATLPPSVDGLNLNPARFTCHAALFQAKPGNLGKVYIGTAGMVRATLAGVSAVLAIPTVNSIPSYSISLTLAPAGIDLSELFIDADTAGEGVLLTILVT